MPLAPGLFSITNGWPVLSSMYLPTRRAVMSPEPPGANGTTMWTGFVGPGVGTLRAAEGGERGKQPEARGETAIMRNVRHALQSRGNAAHGQRTALQPYLAAMSQIRPSAAHRHPRRRLHARDRRSALHANPLGHGRRGHQDREPRRRRRHAQGRRPARRRPDRREPLLHDLQSRQEERRARFHQARGPEDRAQAAREGRRGDPEFPAGRAEPLRARLCRAARGVSAADLRLDLGLRPDRTACPTGRASIRSCRASRA